MPKPTNTSDNQALRLASPISAGEGDEEGGLPGIDGIKAPQPSLGRLIDFIVFYETMELAKVEPDSQLRAHSIALAKLTQDDFLLDATTFIEPLFSTHGLGKFKAKWKIITRHATTFDRFAERGTYLRNFFAALGKKTDVVRSVFGEPRLLTAAHKLIQASKAETAPDALQVLGSMRVMGGMTRLRQWVKEAVAASGVVIEPFDEAVATAGEAQDIGAQIADTDLGLQHAQTPEQAQELQEKRGALVAQLDAVAAQSPNPAATIAQAALAAQPRAYLTKVGEKLGMNPVQEHAMVQSGKVVIAAGAGSGKTRVLSGKVVWLVNEQGASPEAVLATSFTRKSAAELKERIIKAGVDIADRTVAADGFGTTHSIAAKLINRFKPGIPKRKGIGGKDGHSQGKLYRLAIAQVKMKPNGTVMSKPDPNESFFSQPALDTAVKNFTPTKKDEAPPVDPSTAVPFTEAVDRGLAWLKTSDAQRLNNLPWLRAWQGKPPGYDLVKVCTNIFNDIKYGRLTRENMSDKQRQRFMEVMRTANINFVPKVSASVAAAVKVLQQPVIEAAAKKGEFSQYDKVPANQWFNLGAVIEKIRDEMNTGAENDPLKDFTPGNVGRWITKWKGSLVTPGMAYAGLENDTSEMRFIAAAYAAYEWIKANDPVYVGSGDPDDLLINFSKLAIADSKFLDSLQRRFKHVLVDEAQDQNPAQHLMFGLITGSYDPKTQQPRTDGKMTALTYAMIGDDKQAIYEFRGAAPNIYIDNSDTKGGQFKTEFLDTNYRSGRQIVEAAGNLISHNKHQIPMACKPHDPRGEGAIRVVTLGSHEAAAKMVAEQVKAGVADGNKYEDYGVGCRTNKEAYAFTTELLKAGITFRSKFNPLTHRNTKALLNWVFLANTDESNTTAINSLVVKCLAAPSFQINQKTLEDRLQQLAAEPGNKGKSYLKILEEGGWSKIYLKPGTTTPTSRNEELVKPFVDALRFGKDLTGKPSDVINKILTEIKGADGASMLDALIKREEEDEGDTDEEGQDENIDKEEGDGAGEEQMSEEDKLKKRKENALAPMAPVIELATNYGDVSSFTQYIQDLGKANDKIFFDDGDPAVQDKILNAVNVDTVHGWKGLEVPHMYIPMAGGTFPFFKGDIDSERRLGYVAITRGEDSVTIFSIPKPPRKPGELPLVSPFIEEIKCKAETPAAGGVVESSVDPNNEAFFPEWANIVVDAAPEERRGKALLRAHRG